MSETIKIPSSKIKEYYQTLRDVANLEVNNQKSFADSGIDTVLTRQDLFKYKESPTFKMNPIFRHDYSVLKAIYQKAVQLDQADGKLDGNIQRTGPKEITIEIGKEKQNNGWSKIVAPYLDSIFPLLTSGPRGMDQSSGTTWIIEREEISDGKYRYWCITNAHVIDNMINEEYDLYSIAIKTETETVSIPVKVQGVDHFYDVGVVSFVSDKKLNPLVTANDSTSLRANDAVMIVGNQSGSGITQTAGTVNATAKYQLPGFTRKIQDDSSALPGNSGSPVFDHGGQIIAIVNSGSTATENFNIPIEYVLNSYHQIKKQGEAAHGYLPLSANNNGNLTHLGKAELRAMGINKYTHAFFVTLLPKGSALEKAGLSRGTVILAYDGQPVPPSEKVVHLNDYISQKKPGETIEFTVYKNGQIQNIKVKVQSKVIKQYPTYETPYGLTVIEGSSDYKESLGFPKETPGLVMTYEETTNYQRKRNTNILFKVNDTPVDSIQNLKDLFARRDIEYFVFHELEVTRHGLKEDIWVEKNHNFTK